MSTKPKTGNVFNHIDQRDSPPFEVIIVDNGSIDEISNVINEFEEEYPEIVVGYKEEDIQSSYAARNTGITYTSDEMLAFTDTDVKLKMTESRKFAKFFKKRILII
ncbi:glycosyltransferase family A protein [Halorubrum rubrum]|uniref:Glycosyltransferase family A protein n=1 Tax=Halorubrum rubrum TaxID=1126240 RepID=A0ABD5R4A0_9EURY|nr:glycosyltransferase family A protein [Halorubrum rubrum]